MRLETLEDRSVPTASALDGLTATYDLQVFPSAATAFNSGLTPAQVKHAYGLDKVGYFGTGQTITIVVAYDDPNIQSDLNVFDQAYGILGTTITKVNLGGSTTDAGWSLETALDVEWAHVIAPRANIVLVEAATDSLNDLLAAVNVARNYPGASVVSMSWGSSEFRSETAYDSYFTTPAGHTPVAFVAAAGDEGAWAGATWPSVSTNVLSVGGTTLTLDAQGNYRSETTWSGGGGGYSRYESEPAYQQALQSSGRRATPDVSYDASPNTGFAVYDSVPYFGSSGWAQIGGTSAGTPQWAGLLALADQGRALSGQALISSAPAAAAALSTSAFHDVTSGSNGYRAASGYDLATGRGTPVASVLVPSLMSTSATVTAAAATTSSTSTAAAPSNRLFAVRSVVTVSDTSTMAINVGDLSPTAIRIALPTGGTSLAAPQLTGAAPVILPSLTAPLTTVQVGGTVGATGDASDDSTTAPVVVPTVEPAPAAVPVPPPAPAAPAPPGRNEPPMLEAEAGDRAEAPPAEAEPQTVVRKSWLGLAAALVAGVGLAEWTPARRASRKPAALRRRDEQLRDRLIHREPRTSRTAQSAPAGISAIGHSIVDVIGNT
jgi:hypothetical protein